MSSAAVGVTMKDGGSGLDSLKGDIAHPVFFTEVSELTGVDIMQGQVFIEPAHYERSEQIFCAIDGFIQLKLVPHVFKQEVYAGKPVRQEVGPNEYNEDPNQQSPPREHEAPPPLPNYSPVNFFDIDLGLYPLFAEISRRYTVVSNDGDCLYIPAYYFY